eukprot:332856_1
MTQSQNHWTTHKDPEFDLCVSHIFKLNETELLILLHEQGFRLASLWSYNILNQDYTKIISRSTLLNLVSNFYAASLDNNKSLLYVFDEKGKIMKINLKTKQIALSSQSYHDGSCSRALFINKQFHIFGGWDENDKAHFIWDENKKALIEICKFKQIKMELHSH